MQPLEVKKCKKCQRQFASENKYREICFVCEEDEPITFKEALLESPEGQAYIKRKEEEREKFMKDALKENLSTKDKILFSFYKRLADYFAGGNRVVTLQERDAYDNSKVGIKIYGKDYWYNEKETTAY